MILDLLKRWQALEPDRCQFNGYDEAFQVFNGDGHSQLINPHRKNPLCLAWVEWVAIESIVRHNALYNLANEEGTGRHFAYVRGGDCLKTADDDDRTAALLSAYVGWLELIAAKPT